MFISDIMHVSHHFREAGIKPFISRQAFKAGIEASCFIHPSSSLKHLLTMCEKDFCPLVMSTPLNTFENDQEVQDLLEQIKDAKTEVQRTEDELKQVNKDTNKCKEELDQRTMMMVQMDEGLWNSLLELDSVMQERKSLENQLQELTSSSTIESQQALLNGLQEEKSSLLEQEHNLQLRCEQLRKAFEGPSSNIEKVSQSENRMKPDSSGQSKSTVKPVRKRGGRK